MANPSLPIVFQEKRSPPGIHSTEGAKCNARRAPYIPASLSHSALPSKNRTEAPVRQPAARKGSRSFKMWFNGRSQGRLDTRPTGCLPFMWNTDVFRREIGANSEELANFVDLAYETTVFADARRSIRLLSTPLNVPWSQSVLVIVEILASFVLQGRGRRRWLLRGAIARRGLERVSGVRREPLGL